MNAKNRFFDLIGIERGDEDDVVEEEVVEERAPRAERERPRKRDASNEAEAIENAIPNASAMKMVVYHPMSYDDAQSVIDNLKSGRPVIVNVEEVDPQIAQRIFDFLTGAVYALNGKATKVARCIFAFSPKSVDVISNEPDEGYFDGNV
ncbi:MAG TPA: cell division protein SepF [Eubacteriales bacterium]|nr:cell division protein SepF [Clostridia bacterium]HRV72291.1 cell division protein SepF [Eubacteriales bacterium]